MSPLWRMKRAQWQRRQSHSAFSVIASNKGIDFCSERFMTNRNPQTHCPGLKIGEPFSENSISLQGVSKTAPRFEAMMEVINCVRNHLRDEESGWSCSEERVRRKGSCSVGILIRKTRTEKIHSIWNDSYQHEWFWLHSLKKRENVIKADLSHSPKKDDSRRIPQRNDNSLAGWREAFAVRNCGCRKIWAPNRRRVSRLISTLDVAPIVVKILGSEGGDEGVE